MRLPLLSAILRIRVSPETLVIGPRAAFGRAGGSFALGSEEEVRRRLIRALGDPAALDALRRFWGQWQSEASRVATLSDRQLIDRVAATAAGGPLAAYVSPDTGMRHTPGASGKKLGERRQRAESAVIASHRRREAASLAPGAASSRPPGLRAAAAAPPLPFGPPPVATTTAALQSLSGGAFRVSAITLEQRLDEVMGRAAASTLLGAEMSREFLRLLEPSARAMTVMVLAVWASPAALAVGFIVDAAVAAAGLPVMGWAIVNLAEKLHAALDLTRNARSEADLDAAAEKVVQAIAGLGVDRFLSLITYGAGRIARVPQPSKTGLAREAASVRPPPQRIVARPPPERPPPRAPAPSGPALPSPAQQAVALRRAGNSGAPFCEICQGG